MVRTTRATAKRSAVSSNASPAPSTSQPASAAAAQPPSLPGTDNPSAGIASQPSASLGIQASSWSPQLPLKGGQPSNHVPASAPQVPFPARSTPALAAQLPSPMQWTPGLLPHHTPHPVAGCAWGTPLAVAQGVRPAGGLQGFPQGTGAAGNGVAWSSAAPQLHHAGRCVMPAAARQASCQNLIVSSLLDCDCAAVCHAVQVGCHPDCRSEWCQEQPAVSADHNHLELAASDPLFSDISRP